MLNRWSFLVLLSGVLLGYAFAGSSARAQTELHTLAVGDAVTLWYARDAAPPELGNSVQCAVEEIRGLYVKCGRRSRVGSDSDAPDRWLTLKYVVQINKRQE